MKSETTRQKVERLLKNQIGGITPSKIVGTIEEDIDTSEVIEHIRHINESRQVYIAPPECRNCSFNEFNNILDPTKCPKCGSQSLVEPKIKID